MHRRIAERIADAGNLSKTDTVLEIVPGTGMLTRALLERAGKVVAVEADGELVTELKKTFASEIMNGSLTLVHDDIRKFDPSMLGTYSLIANIPYYITGEIIRMFLTAEAKPSSMTLLVQKEVAERVARAKKESLLSLSVKVYGTPKYQFTVPRGAFRPAPNVDSAVLTISDIHGAFASRSEETAFFEVLRAGFAHKRKLLAGNLAVLAPAAKIASAFTEAGIPEKARSEDVPLAGWRSLASALST